MTMCLLCALRAMVNAQPIPYFNESPAYHAAAVHPDPLVASREKAELMKVITREQIFAHGFADGPTS